MKRIEFSNVDEYLTFVESLLQESVSEIIKEPSEEYIFKANGTWYKIFYAMLVGTDFRSGKTLILQVGLERNNFEIDYTWQTIDDRVKKNI